MGIFSRKGASPVSLSSGNSPPAKTEYDAKTYPVQDGLPQQEIHGIEFREETKLTRGLKARHITMIAIGGAIELVSSSALVSHSVELVQPPC